MRNVVALSLILVLFATAAVAQDWGYIPVSNSLNHILDVKIGDLNGDTFSDLVTTQFQEGNLVWWENDGDGQYTPHPILTGRGGMARVDIADVDNDGDLDIGYAQEGWQQQDHHAGWVSNDNGDGSVWTDHVIADESQGNLGKPWEIRLFDMDGDDDLDAVVAGDQIGWFSNPGDGVSYWIRTDVDFNNYQRVGLSLGDMNGDGETDVISAREDGLVWWRDLSFGNDGTNWQHFSVGNNFQQPRSIDTGDFDGDGDNDILVCGDDDPSSKVSIFYNVTGSGSGWDRTNISYGFFGALDVDAIDLDQDGDLDAVGAARGDNEIAWWENRGAFDFEKHVITILYNGAVSVEPGNIDMDDDIEVVGTAFDGDRIGFWDMNSSIYNAELTLTPLDAPIMIPESGTFFYDLYFTVNSAPGNLLCEYWMYAILQNTRESNVAREQFTYVPGTVYDIPSIEQWTNGAPPGGYTWVVGVDVANEYVTDSFEFIILDTANGARNGGLPWQMSGFEWVGKPAGETAELGTGSELPSEYALEAAYPNPFNPSTTVTVALPDAANLTVRAFNVNGQQVAEIANGRYNAGTHALTFNASSLASGLYFIQAQVPGQLNATQKVMLVR